MIVIEYKINMGAKSQDLIAIIISPIVIFCVVCPFVIIFAVSELWKTITDTLTVNSCISFFNSAEHYINIASMAFLGMTSSIGMVFERYMISCVSTGASESSTEILLPTNNTQEEWEIV
jgi:hypothetical protein